MGSRLLFLTTVYGGFFYLIIKLAALIPVAPVIMR